MESVPDDEREVAIGKADIPKGKKAASAFGGKKLDLPKHIRMLVVDDMEMNRKVVIRKLSTLKPFKELEWSFTQAKNGEEALKVLEDEGLDKFDVVWMDEILSLTGGIMLGSETIRIIRGREERKRGRKRSVVVSSTGNTTEKDCALYLDAGADFVAAKPTPGAGGRRKLRRTKSARWRRPARGQRARADPAADFSTTRQANPNYPNNRSCSGVWYLGCAAPGAGNTLSQQLTHVLKRP